MINGTIRVTVAGIRHNQVRLAFEAPDQVGIYREELCGPARPVEELPELPVSVSPDRRPVPPGP